ncbi:YdeI/OmpD-associated family protein [Fluviicola sp.]|uniref:YdeI/OmpD-associated family protein n=1 Tax=Fluviicola sp. TaxID=1917219 RepID=UPI0026227D7A|nr:YdeI/OmpD-associated family protein [Fluviicola sp.]
MKQLDDRITAYISNSADFAQPILTQLRETIHAFCPEVEEGWKWSFPHFMYRGKILCSMASFKNHCAFGFWLQSEMSDPYGIFKRAEEGGMGSLGKITALSDLPGRDQLGAGIVEAMHLIGQGVKPRARAPKTDKSVLEVPAELQAVLDKNPQAKRVFEGFPPSHKKEYIVWIAEAKRAETRQRRLEQMLENLKEGKSKEWKYGR